MDFPGKSRLVAALDAAVGHPSQEAVIAALGRTLAALFADPGFVLPPALLRPVHDHYARRELHVSPTLDYSVVAMTWAPGQGTPIHDHDGAWCTEIVWHGRLAITRYAPTERDGERWRFARIGSEELPAGATDWLAPPHELYRKGAMLGFDGRHGRGHIYRAILEAIALTMKGHSDAMFADLGKQPRLSADRREPRQHHRERAGEPDDAADHARQDGLREGRAHVRVRG